MDAVIFGKFQLLYLTPQSIKENILEAPYLVPDREN